MGNRCRCASMIASRKSKMDERGSSSIVVDVLNRSKTRAVTLYKLRRLTETAIKTVLSEHEVREAEVSVLYVDDEEMAELNCRHRGVAGPTDVLSFPMRDSSGRSVMPSILGDIVVSVETANRQAEEAGHSPQQEIAFLLIHGLLHLLGFDHEGRNKEAKEMRRYEEAYRGIVREETALIS